MEMLLVLADTEKFSNGVAFGFGRFGKILRGEMSKRPMWIVIGKWVGFLFFPGIRLAKMRKVTEFGQIRKAASTL
jgi:hypothetical protein